jgi:aspartate/methionine/tyrosine aminotransferase
LNEIPSAVLGRENVSSWALKEQGDGSWIADLDELKRMIRPGQTKCIFVNSPHNPTGFAFSKQDLSSLIDLCRSHGIYLFSDEVYGDLFYDQVRTMITLKRS